MKQYLSLLSLLLLSTLLSAQISISGNVTFGSADGEPIPDWEVTFAFTEGQPDGFDFTNENGEYLIELTETIAGDEVWRVQALDICNFLQLTAFITPVPGQTSYVADFVLCDGFTPPPPPDCEAHFYYEQSPDGLANTVQFFDISYYEDPTTTNWFWDFGDGEASIDPNPTHTYEASGEYLVTHTIFAEDDCTSTTVQVITVFNEDDCECPTDEYDPVCVYTPSGELFTFSQPCLAECAGYTADEYFDCNDNNCGCPEFYAPVCVTTGTGEVLDFDNHCFAECEGYGPDQWMECEPEPCECDDVYDPVCVLSPFGFFMPFDNACFAACAGFGPDEIFPCDGNCGCPEFYDPICVELADGTIQSFDNFCFAQCAGYGEDQWVACENDCECPDAVYDPVCVATPGGLILTFTNACFAECEGYGEDVYYSCEPTGCECPEYLDPVCVDTADGTITFSNPCFAECEGYTPDQYYHCDDNCNCEDGGESVCVATPFGVITFPNECYAECAGYGPEDMTEDCPGDCVCEDVWAPVCVEIEEGIVITFGNACEAECFGFTSDQFVPCEEDCICPQVYAPVCVLIDPIGGETIQYSNLCYAECDGYTIDDIVDCPAPCICDEVWDPVCVLLDDGTETSFQNACVAACEGYTEADFVECTDCGCEDDLLPVCAIDPTTGDVIEFNNPCLAICAGYSFEDILFCDPSADCYANFTYEFTGENDGLTVQFTDQSTLIDGATAWLWDFGDGNTSNEQNPTHTYTEAGVYDIYLTVSSPDCGDLTTSYHICIGDGGGVGSSCQAFFFLEQPDPDNLLFFQFIDLSLANATAWLWDFGDGNTSNEQNPTHTYAEAGVYAVTLSIIGDDCETSVQIMITAGENYWYGDLECRAWFLPIINPGTSEVFFINLSSADAVNFSWDFGDGNTSTDPLALHVYEAPGVYTVTLTIISATGCTNTFSATVTIGDEEGYTSNPSFSLISDTEDLVSLEELNVAPNPTRGQVQISWQPETAANYSWQLFDLNGRLIRQQQSRSSGGLETIQLDLSREANGIYLFRLQTPQGQQTVRLSKL